MYSWASYPGKVKVRCWNEDIRRLLHLHSVVLSFLLLTCWRFLDLVYFSSFDLCQLCFMILCLRCAWILVSINEVYNKDKTSICFCFVCGIYLDLFVCWHDESRVKFCEYKYATNYHHHQILITLVQMNGLYFVGLSSPYTPAYNHLWLSLTVS